MYVYVYLCVICVCGYTHTYSNLLYSNFAVCAKIHIPPSEVHRVLAFCIFIFVIPFSDSQEMWLLLSSVYLFVHFPLYVMSCLFDLSGTFPIKLSHALGFKCYLSPNKLSWSRPQLPNLKGREDSFWPPPHLPQFKKTEEAYHLKIIEPIYSVRAHYHYILCTLF